MSTAEKIKHEITAVLLAALYFAIWFGALLVNKSLILAEYHIAFTGFSKALIGALILSKVVLIMEHVPLGSWVRSQPAWIDVFLRTALYSLGVLAVLILEKGPITIRRALETPGLVAIRG
jgi:succinate dehydrogenase hydrophobic anchor subunit